MDVYNYYRLKTYKTEEIKNISKIWIRVNKVSLAFTESRFYKFHGKSLLPLQYNFSNTTVFATITLEIIFFLSLL